MSDIYDRLRRRPATKQALVDEFKADPIDLRNHLQALKNKGLIYVVNNAPMWFAKGYKLRPNATNEEIKEYALALWALFDPEKNDPIKRTNALLKAIKDTRQEQEDKDNPIMGYHPVTGDPQRLKDGAW